MKETLLREYRQKTTQYLSKAQIVLTNDEQKAIEVVDFGLNNLETIGLEIITYVNTERVCAKELVLFPYQTCPEHMHPDTPYGEGKEETFRCRKGRVYLYVEGENTETIHARLPETTLTVFHEIILDPGKQYTIMPKTKHWFQAGEDGAIISEFSTKSTDEFDIFTDARIKRIPSIEENL